MRVTPAEYRSRDLKRHELPPPGRCKQGLRVTCPGCYRTGMLGRRATSSSDRQTFWTVPFNDVALPFRKASVARGNFGRPGLKMGWSEGHEALSHAHLASPTVLVLCWAPRLPTIAKGLWVKSLWDYGSQGCYSAGNSRNAQILLPMSSSDRIYA